jgi:hypothetical protein
MPETARHRETEVSDKKYCETTIGELRKTYGADFAKGCANNGGPFHHRWCWRGVGDVGV